MKPLVSTSWLEDNYQKVRIIDATWHMPSLQRDPHKEFFNEHIPGSVFFDLDKNSDQTTTIPHMLPKKESWQKIVSNFGIKNFDHIIIYDNSNVMSSCRCWFTFIYFGHDPNLVSVLDGGLKKWKLEGKDLTKEVINFPESKYIATFLKDLVKDKGQIERNIKTNDFKLIDARSSERFNGLVPEPRKGLNSGSIKNSLNFPFIECINKSDSTFKSPDELLKIFQKYNALGSKDIVFTCGSGVTACILGLANSIISGKTPMIYDGSWSEYGLKNK